MGVILLLIISVSITTTIWANSDKQAFRLAQILQDKMVMQQGKPFRFWGWAPANSTITIKTSWHSNSFTTQSQADGTWLLPIDVPSVKNGDYTKHQITIRNASKEFTLSDILIGEVWFCSGQSNMNMSMEPNRPYHEGVYNFKEEIAAANHPNLRIIRVERAASDTPLESFTGTWQHCKPETVASFGAVAYYYGRQLQQQLDIPVGIVLSAFGGSSCQSWTPKETLLSEKTVKKRFWDRLENDDKVKPFIRPRMLYNAMVHPVRHLSIRGFLWYQGESNAGDKLMYTRLNRMMIESWRDVFGQGRLPFYFVQMTPYNWKKDSFYLDSYAYFREAQERIVKLTPETGLIVTMDNDEVSSIHPRNKAAFAYRLAQLALAKTYQLSGIAHSGPNYQKMIRNGNQVRIELEPGSAGLTLKTSDGLAPKHFYIAGNDKIFYEAVATIEGNSIVLSAKEVKEPVAVRYAFLNFPVTNLCNTAGWPAHPFRTDKWENVTYAASKLSASKN
jgi:sialate O-acetylesterase